MLEAPDRRERPRKRLDIPCSLSIDGRSVKGLLLDLSEIGALFRIAGEAADCVDSPGTATERVVTSRGAADGYSADCESA